MRTNKLRILSFTIAFLVIFQACRPEPLEITIDPVESQVVVFSHLLPWLQRQIKFYQVDGKVRWTENKSGGIIGLMTNNYNV